MLKDVQRLRGLSQVCQQFTPLVVRWRRTGDAQPSDTVGGQELEVREGQNGWCRFGGSRRREDSQWLAIPHLPRASWFRGALMVVV